MGSETCRLSHLNKRGASAFGMQCISLYLKYRNLDSGMLFFPYFTNYDDIKDN